MLLWRCCIVILSGEIAEKRRKGNMKTKNREENVYREEIQLRQGKGQCDSCGTVLSCSQDLALVSVSQLVGEK